MMQASLNLEDGSLCLLPASVVAIPAYVGSKVYTAHAVSQLLGQPSVTNIAAATPQILASLYEKHDVSPTDKKLSSSS